MAFLQRVPVRRAGKPVLCLALSTESPPVENVTEAPSSSEEAAEKLPEAEAEAEAEGVKRHYRTNTLLPKCAFLFPAKPRSESKRLHLQSLRRANFSTAVCPEERPRSCAWGGTCAVGNAYFCSRCEKVLPVESILDHFRIFDLQPSFDIDVAALDRKYREIQMRLHPDRFATKAQQEQDLATAQATIINRAYKKLKRPLDRAKYLLRLKGFQFEKEQTIKDPEFLMEMLEIQERVAETEDREELLDVLSETRQRRQTLERDLSEKFQRNDLDSASDIVTELSYLERILERTQEKL